MHSRLITLLMLAAFGSAASVRIADPLLPVLIEVFGASTRGAAQTVTLFALAYGVMQLVYGPLGDRYGKLHVIALACLACTAGSVGAALAPSLEVLIAFRFLSGATAAALVPLSIALIGDLVPYEQRQSVLARYISGGVLGLITGQSISGLLADMISWRAPFVFLAVMFAIVGLLLAELRRGSVAEPIGGRSAQPLLSRYREVLSVGWARLVILVAFVEGAATFGALAFVPTYLHLRYGLSLSAAGGVVALFGGGGLLYALVARRLIARLGERGLVLCGALILGLGFAIAAALGDSWWPALPALLAAGLGFYMFHNTLQTHATQMTAGARGTAVSLFAASLFTGNSVGVMAAALAVEAGQERWPFAAAALVLPVLGFCFQAVLRRRARSAVLATEA